MKTNMIFSELLGSEYDIPNKGVLVAPNGTFDTEREEHYAYSIKATSSNPFASGVIEGMATNVIGAGFRLQSRIDHDYLGISHEAATAISKKLESIFSRYALSKGISITGDKNLHQLADIAYRTQLVTGNCFALLINEEDEDTGIGLKIKLLDSAYLYDNANYPLLNMLKDTADNEEVDAIVRSSSGRITAYTFYKEHPYNMRYVDSTTTVDHIVINVRSGIKRNVLHLYESKRAGQIIAVPFISVIAQVLEDIGEYAKAEIDAAKLNAHFAGFIYNDAVDESGGLDFNKASQGDTSLRIGKGNLLKLDRGWKITFADPARPAEHYSAFVEAKIKELCIAINYPFEMFMKLFNTSYTASRGAVIEGQKMFKVRRLNMMYDFYQPIYEQIILEELLAGRLHLKGFFDDPFARTAWLGGEWIADAQEDMNKLNAVKASDAAVKAGFSDRDREAKILNGSNYAENIHSASAEADLIEATKIPYVGEMNPQKVELAEMASEAIEKRLENGDKPNRFGDKKQKGDG